VAFLALGGAMLVAAFRPSLLDAVFGPPLPPPGAAATAVETKSDKPAPKLPTVCEATLVLEGVPVGSEVARRLGSTPSSVVMPMHVALDLIATLDGHAPRRAHVDPTATWTSDATSARLDLSFGMEAKADAPWPTATPTPLRVEPSHDRGLLRLASTPSGANVWVVVDPASIGGIPCGAPVDLLVVEKGSNAPKQRRIEWSAFTGAPPRAVQKWIGP
jgi:hypothetical protein